MIPTGSRAGEAPWHRQRLTFPVPAYSAPFALMDGVERGEARSTHRREKFRTMMSRPASIFVPRLPGLTLKSNNRSRPISNCDLLTTKQIVKHDHINMC